MQMYINENRPINNRYPALKNAVVYTAGDEDQFQTSRVRDSLHFKPLSLDTTNERDRGEIFIPLNQIFLNAKVSNKNLFENETIMSNNWFKYQDLDSRSVYHTFLYIFQKFKKGIFVRISDNKLTTFLPFNNMSYKNEFSDRLRVDPKWKSVPEFLNYISRKKGFKNTQIILPLDEWVANNALVRFEKRTDEDGGNITTLLNMFETLCENRNVPDIEFFINRRDFPLIKTNDTEPYNHIYDSKHFPLVSHKYDKYSPILSGSVSENYADVAFPTYEDWARVLNQYGEVVIDKNKTWPIIKSIPWSEKKNKAIFRGSSTGAGVTENTNKRLKALEIANANPSLLDVELSWNLRPRKYEGEKYLQTIERTEYPPIHKLSLQEQSEYKYILNIEGHVAAYRLSYELSSGSVILLVESEWKMWYQYKLKPYFHYIPVKSDLSDLIKQIKWCILNDDQCKQIAENAKHFYKKFLGPQGILDFCQKLLWEMVDITGVYNYYPDLILWSVNDELNQLKLLDEQRKFKSYKFNIPDTLRSIGFLDGISQILQHTPLQNIRWIRHLFQNVNGTIDMFSLNNVTIIGKKAFSLDKNLETIHEAFIGFEGINKIVGKIPNFIYTFGSKIQDEITTTFSEFINGPTLLQWLQSPQYNFNEMLAILIQINLALIMAQNMIGFIHYDLFPWNIILKPIESEKIYDYILNHQTIVSFKAKRFIPVLIDYGKSRCIVYEKNYGLIDHGFNNLYEINGIVDTLSVLYGSIAVVKDRLSSRELEILLEFPASIGVPYYRDIKYCTKYGNLFRFKNFFRPKNFVDFMISKHPVLFQNIVLKKTGNFSYPLENGHVIFTEAQALGLNPFIEIIKHIDRNGTVNTTNELFRRIATDIFNRRSQWFDNIVVNNFNANKMWKELKVKLFAGQFLKTPTIISDSPSFGYPKPPSLFIDFEISPDTVKNLKLEKNTQDWMKIYNLYLEAYIFGIITSNDDFFPEILNFLRFDSFLYLNAIAAHNTLLKIKENHPIDTSIETWKEYFEMYGGGAGVQNIMVENEQQREE